MSEEHTDQTRPTSITELRPKMQLEGVIRRIELYGAFVDIGLERDGLIHISQLSDRRVDRVTDVVKEGERVTVWVTRVDPDQGRVALSMVRPPDVAWGDLSEGQTYTGSIVRIERYGVFVDIGAERPGLLHVREMGSGGFHRPSEMFRTGDEVEVSIRQVDRRKKRIDLAMGDLVDTEIDTEEDGEALPTAVEIAFRRAQEEARQQQKRRRAPAAKKARLAKQEEILARTLKQHAQ